MNKNKSAKALVMLFAFLITVLIIAIGGFFVVSSMLTNRKTQSLETYYGDYNFATVNGMIVNIGNYDEMYLGEPSLPVSFVQDYIDEYIFWEPDTNRVTVTTASEVIKMKTDDLTYYINDEPMNFTISSYRDESEAYIPKSILETLYPIEVTYAEETGVIIVTDYTQTYNETTTKKKTPIKYKADGESANSYVAEKGETVRVFQQSDDGKYTKVQTTDGYVGYVLTKHLNKTINEILPNATREETVRDLTDEKIILLWDQVTTTTAANRRASETIPTGVNVLSPTFFSFDADKNDGTIVSIASSTYVSHAHANDVQVWALITDNFSTSMNDTILRNADTREYVIDQLIGYIRLYNLDGINIDFEAVPERNADYFIQFLRELYPRMREEGAILSVDTYVPSNWSMYYNRTAIGETVDYVCIMSYDEHTSVSSTTGPVASVTFVENGVRDTLDEVPKEQVLMGIPFYTRIWKVKADDPSSFTLSNYSMDAAYKFFRDNSAQIVFDDTTGYYYARFDTVINGENYYYEAWLEDEESLKLKMEIYNKYDVQGVAVWKRGLEQRNSHDIIKSNIE